jgi:hypothetical protein
VRKAVNFRSLAYLLAAQALLLSTVPALAQVNDGLPIFSDGPPPPSVTPPPAATPAPTPTPVPTPTPAPVVPLIPQLPNPLPFRPGVVVPTDVTNLTYSGAAMNPANLLGPNIALNGIQRLDDKSFPRHEPKSDDDGGILVKWRPETIFVRPQNNIVKLTSGEVLISVKAPAKQANLITPIGKVALVANSDILASFEKGIFRVKNVDGCGLKVKIRLDNGPMFSVKPIVVAVAPGYEFTAANHKLTRIEMKPRDGIARRFVKVLEQGQMSIGEFYLAGALASNELLVDLRQSVNGLKERRIIADMSKMAAVLNYQMGTNGFTANPHDDGGRLASGRVKPTN